MTATPRYFTGRVKREARGGRLGDRLDGRRGAVRPHPPPAQLRAGHRPGPALRLPGRGRRRQRQRARTTSRSAARSSPATARRSRTRGRLPARSDCYERWRTTTCTASSASTPASTTPSRFASSLLDSNEWLPARRRPSGKLWTDHVSGKMTAGERDVRLRRLRSVERGERGVLTNARCLNEGVDVPTLDGVAFIDPRRSQVDVVQAVGQSDPQGRGQDRRHHRHPRLRGRGRRPGGGARSLRVRPRLAGRQGASRPRRRCSPRNSTSYDASWADARHASASARGRSCSTSRPASAIAFARAFDTQVSRTRHHAWHEGIGHAQAYRKRTATFVFRYDFVDDGFQPRESGLGSRRQERRQDGSPAERVAELDALGMVVGSVGGRTGRAASMLLTPTVRSTAHLRVPEGFVTEDGFQLGRWIQPPTE